MNINATIIGQMIAFAIFVLFCMKFVWPPLIGAINERQRKIEEGLNAAEQAKADLASAEAKVAQEFAAAKVEAASIIDRANKTANQMIEEAKDQARLEGERIIAQAQLTIEQEAAQSREKLRSEVAHLAVFGAEKILQSKVNEQEHASMLEQLAAKL
ncbi:F0F1 ATP synthase subunit B [Moraxella nasovis]|uniref:F0F1 ATP synthase subunit B n=1 Tax=Moraxella nasovis TaxID=2904121 RepID=UPI001F60B859|nr:F0F1 ATP synthase subunit B [Moraxella nasovis]UNU72703.1 F0F1 ATP synthase subunit B [Moraxella nasovis]